jgi:hypothetical protein
MCGTFKKPSCVQRRLKMKLHLTNALLMSVEPFRNRPGFFDRVQQSLIRRVQSLFHSDGGHINHVVNRDLNGDRLNKNNPSY